jgi:hypothetical protein
MVIFYKMDLHVATAQRLKVRVDSHFDGHIFDESAMTEVIMTKLDGLFFYNYQKIKIFNIG